ncbi:hypothetical protein F2Q69_00058554 [Brassica cretica]|uniref:Uncharacterized protein n=1 Tax=Brassica cretica TaxID=69181 RepID=A0A8S9RJ94_BRACR|nr:hypothetical protein F2Q69_00058554 [Brassica cretica]
MCIDENVNGTSIGAEVVNSDQAFVYAQSVSEQMVTVMMTMIMPQQHEWIGLKGTASRPSSPSFHPVFFLTDKIDPSPIHLIDPASQPATFGEAMEYYSEEEDSFDSSQDSNIDETDRAWSSKEDGCERSCSADEYSSSEYGDDPGEKSPEPEPPDHSQGNIRFYKKGGCRENKSWSIDTDSEISMGSKSDSLLSY